MRKGVTHDPKVVSDLLARTDVLWLALTDESGPHCVPVNFAEEDGVIYIHSGRRGRKAACLDSGNRVAFSAALDIEKRKGGDDACNQGYRFKSVMGNGTPRELTGDEKMHGLDLITVKHLGRQLPYVDKVLPITAVYAIDIEEATARIKE
ncbi:pyridoxamine 5'-phosphate oxidase family protein [Pseudodesulfovibrio portus]|uniref:MFS transporter n=1 Tax=Pseudodesulfovibrio portus TaxID=231439 RepID=A0ABN6S038_9BACT|nr:pyridoxamine 5'-phosphate oxidase family protein [Pseudodesulfovibrio portus]BDQ35125.1 MFS transporter [Pseudodesulfovibrio portus]